MRDEVFISYRVGDTDAQASALREYLDGRYGPNTSYLFAAANRAGEDFQDRIALAVSRARAIVALIGPNWLRGTESGPDWVHAELKEAFAAGTPVIPVLVDGATAPSTAERDPVIARIARLHAQRLDMAALADLLAASHGVGRTRKGLGAFLRGIPGSLWAVFFSPRRYFLGANDETAMQRLGMAFVLYLIVSALVVALLEFSSPERFIPHLYAMTVAGVLLFGLVTTILFATILFAIGRGGRHVRGSERVAWAWAVTTNALLWWSIPSIVASYAINAPAGREFKDNFDAAVAAGSTLEQALISALERAGDTGGMGPEAIVGTVFLLAGIVFIGYGQWVIRSSLVWRRMLGQHALLSIVSALFVLLVPPVLLVSAAGPLMR